MGGAVEFANRSPESMHYVGVGEDKGEEVIRSWVTSKMPIRVFGRVYLNTSNRADRLIADTVNARRTRLTDLMIERTGCVVQLGLFEGTVLPPPMAWGAEDYAAMLLGTYEQELHDALRNCLDLHPDMVVNLGCASGLYAAGLGRLLPGCDVVAIDIAPVALTATARAWELNRLGDTNPLELFLGAAEHANLSAWLGSRDRPLVFCDIEGDERELLDPIAVPELTKAILVCELHDHFVPGITELLTERFAPTHHLTFFESGSRDPHALPALADVVEHDRWLAMSEGRPSVGHWMFAVPRSLDGHRSVPASGM